MQLVYKEPGDSRLASDTGCLLSLLPCVVVRFEVVHTVFLHSCHWSVKRRSSWKPVGVVLRRLMSSYMLQSLHVKPCFDPPGFAG